MPRRLRLPICIIYPLLLLPLTLVAEEAARLEAFGGYSLAHVNIATNVPAASPTHVSGSGFNVSAIGYFNRWFGAGVDFSGHFRNQSIMFNDPFTRERTAGAIDTHVFPLHFGPQVRFPVGRVAPFTRLMFGLFRLREEAPTFGSFDNDFSFLVGGGVDVSTGRHLAIRVGQADYIRSHLTPTAWQNNWRFSTGLVLKY